MNEVNLLNYNQGLFERIISVDSLHEAFKAVKKNRGAPGVDGVSVDQFGKNLSEELFRLNQELGSWKYQPQPVRLVEIPKPNGGGVRKLGIPTIRDRVVHASIKSVLEPILDPNFSEHSFGFRPKRNQRQAVEEAQRIVRTGKGYVVDIDLSKFFDRIHHDRLIGCLGKSISDKRVMRLIGMTLRSGIMKDGLVSPTTEGSVQGSPLSPLLSNVVLDELDKELERRGLEHCRFADDCNIFVGSDKAAHRVMQSITKFIEAKLKLKINWDKSKVAPSKAVKFLGATIIWGSIAISPQSMKKAMERVKELIPRGTSLNMEKTIMSVNRWYGGWANYYKMTQFPNQLGSIEGHIRRRLRSRIVDQRKGDATSLQNW